MNRRKLLILLGSLSSASVAGCVGGDDGDAESDSSDNADGDTPDSESDGGTSDDTSDSSDGDGTDSGGMEGEINREESFVMEYEFQGEEFSGAGSSTIRVNGQNVYMTIEGTMNVEAYFVDGDYYQVAGGQCFKNPQNMDLDTPGPVPEPDGEWDPTADIPEEPDGTETIDGETMLVYNFGGTEESIYGSTELTAYVSEETGYLRRVESEEWQVDYHSWGDVDPIEAPDMECREVDSGGGGYGGGDGY